MYVGGRGGKGTRESKAQTLPCVERARGSRTAYVVVGVFKPTGGLQNKTNLEIPDKSVCFYFACKPWPNPPKFATREKPTQCSQNHTSQDCVLRHEGLEFDVRESRTLEQSQLLFRNTRTPSLLQFYFRRERGIRRTRRAEGIYFK